MPKTIEEIRRAPYPEALEVECDHEKRIAQLEEDMARTNVELAQLRIRLDELERSVKA